MTAPWFTVVTVVGAVLAVGPRWRRPRSVVGDPVRRSGVGPPGPIVLVGAVGAGTALLVGPAPVVVLAGAVAAGWRVRTARRRDRAARRVADPLPEVVDLVLLGVAAGLSPSAALRRTADLFPPPYREVMGDVVRRTDRGEPFAVALDRAVVALGPAAQPLVTALATAGRDGGPVAPALHRVADEARHRRRVAAQTRARRLPVAMLLPLVLCVLPAFVLVSIVPLVAASVRDLRLGG